ncbi:MAG: AraC family transcriptional regulator [Candidatus Pseudobacter hemicellulosilyticus]|uniref:AraC family transcriptional regulator n=1 Tax=Candidatus Pseudobacter hemicellulosilyticus TaxID=3121375 RepID=A0AAJ6BJN8_9BACT|nr:MAG: AraC family transcriptional regulator [Pseudobacter sp.]
MFKFDYTYTDYEQLVRELAKKLEVPVVDNAVQFPTAIADGSYQFIILPNGLHATIMNCTMHEDWLVHRKKNPAEEYYVLRFDELSIPGSLVVTIGDDKVKENNTAKAIAYLTSTLFDWSYLSTQGTSFKGIAILFNKEWLAKYLDIATAENVLSTYISLKSENLNIEPLDNSYRRWMRTIMEVQPDNPLRLTIIQNRIMLMIERFFTHLYDKMHNPTFRIPLSPDDINRVMQIEGILTKDIFQSPPSIQQLAKMVSISESKLKKDFKIMYGFPIYEYYQQARMQAAQDKLLTGRFSVKEVAMELGYSNLSNFTIAFKKQFGVLPSQLLSEQ